MNIKKRSGVVFKLIYRYALRARWLFGKQICRTFNDSGQETTSPAIEHIYVINLDRQINRWDQMKQELSYVLDALKRPLITRTTRISAVDARQFETTINTGDIVETYSLGEQLFVDPRHVLPSRLDLDEEIDMSRQEVAVALSHIKVWREIASGHNQYVLVLEDDVHFKHTFAGYLDKIWKQLFRIPSDSSQFDILYLSFSEVDLGAEKVQITEDTFKLFRGIWWLSGYVLSKKGANKLLSLLPVRGPVDLWINHMFKDIDALVISKSIISQRMDEKSENSYSILPMLSKIGVLNSEGPGRFREQSLTSPVFAMGVSDTGLTSLAMALSMLGYRCCSDLDRLPSLKEKNLLNKESSNIFNAYVNIRSIEQYLDELAIIYPEARLIVMIDNDFNEKSDMLETLEEKISFKHNQTASVIASQWSDKILILPSSTQNKWKSLCEFLGNVPPPTAYPTLLDLGQRQLNHIEKKPTQALLSQGNWQKFDTSPWVIKPGLQWNGLFLNGVKINVQELSENQTTIIDHFKQLDESRWHLRDDTFQGNLALFSPLNLQINDSGPMKITAYREDMGVREYSSGSLTTCAKFLFGRFEATLKPPKVSGLVTGIFLHRDSPRQEIDIEFLGNQPKKILVNVYYNPGEEGSRFDYGYRGTPILIDLGFDATEDFHTYAIEWESNEIRWFVDNKLIHTRVNWAPTPIPHLPMKFHVNLWPSESRELAGKLIHSFLPTSTLLQSVKLSTSNVS